MSNADGTYRTTRERDMRAYDKLPPSARRALQNAALNWACVPLMTRWRKGVRGYKTGTEIALKIATQDRQDARKTRANAG